MDKRAQEQKMTELRQTVSDKMNKWGNKIIFSQYTGEDKKKYKEGDVWEDVNEKTWTIKNGLKQSVSKLQSAKTPWWCPKCEKAMGHKFDDKFYRLRGACFDCVIRYESKMRVDGVWELYEKRALRENEKSFLVDHVNKLEDYIRVWREPQAHFQDGNWEVLAKRGHFDEMFEKLRSDMEFTVQRMECIAKEEKEDKVAMKKLDKWLKQNKW